VCNILLNASKVRNYGLEAEIDWHPTRLTRLGGAVAWLRSQIVGDRTEVMSIPVGSTIPDGFVTSGRNVFVPSGGATSARAPEWEINLYAQQGIALGSGTLTARGDVHYVSENYISGYNYLNPAVLTDGTRFGDLYTVSPNTRFDASLRYAPEAGFWSLSLYVKNITKEIVKAQTDGLRAMVEPPRTYGAVLIFDF
jgi:iron complex outermembrane receptor protein